MPFEYKPRAWCGAVPISSISSWDHALKLQIFVTTVSESSSANLTIIKPRSVSRVPCAALIKSALIEDVARIAEIRHWEISRWNLRTFLKNLGSWLIEDRKCLNWGQTCRICSFNTLPFGKGYPSIGFCALGDSALVKTHVAYKNQLLYPTEAVRAKINTLKVNWKNVKEKKATVGSPFMKISLRNLNEC